eukprot:tig00021350_g20641.t1
MSTSSSSDIADTPDVRSKLSGFADEKCGTAPVDSLEERAFLDADDVQEICTRPGVLYYNATITGETGSSMDCTQCAPVRRIDVYGSAKCEAPLEDFETVVLHGPERAESFMDDVLAACTNTGATHYAIRDNAGADVAECTPCPPVTSLTVHDDATCAASSRVGQAVLAASAADEGEPAALAAAQIKEACTNGDATHFASAAGASGGVSTVCSACPPVVEVSGVSNSVSCGADEAASGAPDLEPESVLIGHYLASELRELASGDGLAATFCGKFAYHSISLEPANAAADPQQDLAAIPRCIPCASGKVVRYQCYAPTLDAEAAAAGDFGTDVGCRYAMLEKDGPAKCSAGHFYRIKNHYTHVYNKDLAAVEEGSECFKAPAAEERLEAAEQVLLEGEEEEELQAALEADEEALEATGLEPELAPEAPDAA